MEKDINKTKQKKCFKCPYSSIYGVSDKDKNYSNCTCDYILITKERRKVRPEDCEHYKDRITRPRKEKFTQQ